MKDPDNGRDVKKPDAEDMSLADLLGADAAEEPSTARRVESRKDEPDSGMVNLAKMVAGSSVETAKTPSLAPPPPPAGFDGRDPTGSQAIPVQPGAPVAAPHHKSNAAIWVLVVAVIALGAVGVYFLSQGKDDGKDDAATQALLAKLEELERERKAEEEKRKAEEERIAVLMAKLEAQTRGDAGAVDLAAKAALEKQIAEAKAAQEEAAKKAEEAAQKAEDAKAKAGGTKVAAAGTAKKPAAETDEVPVKKAETKPAASKTETKTETKPAAEKKPAGSQSELDSLLGGGSKKAEEDKKPAAAPADSTPAQLGKAEIQQAMAPVASKAQTMCAKYSTGSVQVKVVVAGATGKVQSAETVGAFANSTAGNCVAALAKTAKFPKFKDATQSFTYPIVLK